MSETIDIERVDHMVTGEAVNPPGYGQSSRPDWIMSVHDPAAWATWLVRDLDLRLPINAIGCSLGGWVGAEITTVPPQFFNKLMLVGAMGLKPERTLTKGTHSHPFVYGGVELRVRPAKERIAHQGTRDQL